MASFVKSDRLGINIATIKKLNKLVNKVNCCIFDALLVGYWVYLEQRSKKMQ